MKGKIKKGDCIATMIFITLAFYVFCIRPDILGWYVQENGETTTIVHLLSPDGVKEFNLLVRVIFTIGILKEALGIYWGRWTIKNAVIYSALDIANTVLMSIFVLQPRIWNANFLNDINKYLNKEELVSKINMGDFRMILYGFIIISFVIAFIEAASHLYKGYKYGEVDNTTNI